MTTSKVFRDELQQHHQKFYDEAQFRVWPDGTVQAVNDGEPHSHMSDDYLLIWAYDEHDALNAFSKISFNAWHRPRKSRALRVVGIVAALLFFTWLLVGCGGGDPESIAAARYCPLSATGDLSRECEIAASAGSTVTVAVHMRVVGAVGAQYERGVHLETQTGEAFGFAHVAGEIPPEGRIERTLMRGFVAPPGTTSVSLSSFAGPHAVSVTVTGMYMNSREAP